MPSLLHTKESPSPQRQRLHYSGTLETYQSHDVTPAIGLEFANLQAKDLLKAPNSDAQIRDLAILVSERGVVFLRDQDIDPSSMKELGERLSALAGRPRQSALHIHPLTEESSELGDQVSVISSAKQKKGGGLTMQLSDTSRFASVGWHADITFEHVPSDYAMLKIHTLPTTGGDTLWASAYTIYDKLSPSLAAYLETLTATHSAEFFHDEAARLGQPIRAGPRGHPLNIGKDLVAVHPVIRTNPVTRRKSLFVNRGFTRRINELTKDESDLLLQYLFNLIPHSHDAQTRLRWRRNDMAIWDNRCTWHCATYDYEALRCGDRVCSVGEVPFLEGKGEEEAF